MSRGAIAPLVLAVLVLPVGLAVAGGPFVDPSTDDDGIEVEDAELSDSAVGVGQTVTVTAEIENVGDRSDSFTARLEIDGEVVQRETVVVDPDETVIVEFAHTFEQPGTYQVWVLGEGPGKNDGEGAGEVTVEKSAAPEFEVTDADLGDSGIETGEVTAVVENHGDAAGSFTAELVVDGEVDRWRTVQVAAGEQTTVRFVRQFEEPGEYAVAVNGTDAGVVTVAESVGEESLDVDVVETVDGARATVRNVAAIPSVTIEFARVRSDEPPIALVAVEVVTDRDAFELTATDPASTAPGLPPVPAGEAVGYVGMEPTSRTVRWRGRP